MESLIHRNEKKELEEKENGEDIESLRITNKYVKKVIYLFITLINFYLGKRNNDE